MTGLPAVTSTAFNITPLAPATVTFTTQPSTTAAGSVITPAVQVTVMDAYGNPVASDRRHAGAGQQSGQ